MCEYRIFVWPLSYTFVGLRFFTSGIVHFSAWRIWVFSRKCTNRTHPYTIPYNGISPPCPAYNQRYSRIRNRVERAYSNVPILRTKRAIKAAFRQIRPRPDSSSLGSAEFASEDMDLPFGIPGIFLPLPLVGVDLRERS